MIFREFANSGWVSVGVDHDTPLRVKQHPPMVRNVGRVALSHATRLLITVMARQQRVAVRLWKRELQKLANELGPDIVVSHLPPGHRKWNRFEAPAILLISQKLARPAPRSYRVIVELISATTTSTGLTCDASSTLANTPRHRRLRRRDGRITSTRRFHGEWNTPSHRIPTAKLRVYF